MNDSTWHLIKASDKQEYGPINGETLLGWASEAKISPMDKLSNDGRQTWQRAPMIRELQMDWLIQMPDQYLYGPTNVATIQEFLATGQVDGNVVLINCVDATESRLSDQPFFGFSPQHTRSAETTLIGSQWPDLQRGASDPHVQQRIIQLEKNIIEYQHSMDEWEQRYNSLRQQFIEATGREPK
ncbi:hypothetical protein EI77_02953 [Prosthecobacter fusiformis]|uniref:GYF domain-containing protein n=1 Tax=Prosthecobacter fusiformis TaxID=48464 RepID=A0A4R7RUG2_9BACT|nr:hypothetical protein [Prosthecobacter fusiformis]TDU69301.1 hypothetical protein EI77_02953 [Prosthecobacter fusiformis]